MHKSEHPTPLWTAVLRGNNSRTKSGHPGAFPPGRCLQKTSQGAEAVIRFWGSPSAPHLGEAFPGSGLLGHGEDRGQPGPSSRRVQSAGPPQGHTHLSSRAEAVRVQHLE